jgi:restriction system protein
MNEANHVNEDAEHRSLTPHFPLYSKARHFLRILNGASVALFRSMNSSIQGQRGTPQETVNWVDPTKRIPERLSGGEQKLAWRVWNESKQGLNPRYLHGSWLFTQRHNLLCVKDDVMCMTERGDQFLANVSGPVVAEIDEYETVIFILRQVADRGMSRRGELLPAYQEYCQGHTTYEAEAVIKQALYDRLVNLLERVYIVRSESTYQITDSGLAYLETGASGGKEDDERAELRRLAKRPTEAGRAQLADYLASMDPFKFEWLVKRLLEEMGYSDVKTTAPTNDKGVDVVGDIQLGISSVHEVVQVKRYKGNINRRVLDELRGSLYRFDAVRGTIISTGGFSQGTKDAAFERGAAPITLIDGERLLDLLIQNGIGARKAAVEYIEFDPSRLTGLEEQEEGGAPEG